MKSRLIPFLFFSNYFIGLLAVALSFETVFQLGLPFNNFTFYLILFSATVVFYTLAYIPSSTTVATNPRTNWYIRHKLYIQRSQLLLATLCVGGIGWQLLYIQNLSILSFGQWLALLSIPGAAIMYYGLWSRAPQLRNIGWLKPFLIGYVWAGAVGLLPVSLLLLENKTTTIPENFMYWLFLKNWMFCTVNAIIFDIKDYADDSNREIKTFVVQAGLRKTIFLIIIPLLIAGFLSFLLFAFYNQFGFLRILLNALPFLLLLYIAFSMQQRKKILYYLIVIDGALLIKSICGIAAAVLST